MNKKQGINSTWMIGVGAVLGLTIIGFLVTGIIWLFSNGDFSGFSSQNMDKVGQTGDLQPTIQVDGCYTDYFLGVPSDRITQLESGVSSFVIIGQNQSKSEVFGILLTENNEPMGGLRVNFIDNGDIFKIESIVDETCNMVAFTNETDPDEQILQNWDSIAFQIQGQNYILRLGYDGNEITIGQFTQVVK